MDPALSACLLLAAYGGALWVSHGEYAPPAIVVTFASFLLLCVVFLAEMKVSVRERTVGKILTALFLLFFGLVVLNPMLRAFTNVAAAYALRDCLWVVLGGFVLFCRQRTRRLGFWVTFIALAECHYLVLLVNPEPAIDIWLFYQKATAHFLAGQNPYSQPDYPEIYRGRYGYPPGLHYLPASVYVLAPFRLFFGEVRVGLWVAQVASALLLGALARAQGLSRHLQGLVVLLWLMFPAGLPVLENCWMDSLMACWCLAALLCWIQHRPQTAAAFFALALATKQTALLVAFVTAGYFVLQRRGSLRSLALAGGGALLMMLPYALWDWPSFWSSVTQVFRNQVRLDSFNLVALASNAYGLEVQFWQTLVIYLFFVPIVFWRLSRKGSDWADYTAAVIMLVGLAFYFGKQAFLNYYDMLCLFVMAYLVLSLKPDGAVESGAQTP